MALLIGAGRKMRDEADGLSPVSSPDLQSEATSEDVLDRYRLAAAV